MPEQEQSSIFSQGSDSKNFNPMGIAAQALGAINTTTSIQSSNDEGPPLNFTHNQGDLTTNS